MECRNERQVICGKRKCHDALQASKRTGRTYPSSGVFTPSKTPDFIRSKQALAADRGTDWAIAINRARSYRGIGRMSKSKLADHLRRVVASLGTLLRFILLSASTIS
jgi:hypothetical protein